MCGRQTADARVTPPPSHLLSCDADKTTATRTKRVLTIVSRTRTNTCHTHNNSWLTGTLPAPNPKQLALYTQPTTSKPTFGPAIPLDSCSSANPRKSILAQQHICYREREKGRDSDRNAHFWIRVLEYKSAPPMGGVSYSATGGGSAW